MELLVFFFVGLLFLEYFIPVNKLVGLVSVLVPLQCTEVPSKALDTPSPAMRVRQQRLPTLVPLLLPGASIVVLILVSVTPPAPPLPLHLVLPRDEVRYLLEEVHIPNHSLSSLAANDVMPSAHDSHSTLSSSLSLCLSLSVCLCVCVCVCVLSLTTTFVVVVSSQSAPSSCLAGMAASSRLLPSSDTSETLLPLSKPGCFDNKKPSRTPGVSVCAILQPDAKPLPCVAPF